MSLESTQPLTEMSTGNLPEGKVRTVRDNLTSINKNDCLENVAASTSHDPTGLHGLFSIVLPFSCRLCLLYDYLRLCGKAVSSSHYVASNGTMLIMDWQVIGRKRTWTNSTYSLAVV
jgi:hypothetical protein